MTELAKRTWPEAEAYFDEKTIAIVPIGSTEPHGPHLPLDTDVTIARAQSVRAAEMLEELGVRAMVLPPIAYGITRYTDGFAGRVTLRPGTLWALLEDIVLSLAQDGIRQIVFSNGHLEPEHVKVIRGVTLDNPSREPGKAQVIFPDNTRRKWAQTLSPEFQSGDCHAGSYESSILLASDPASVRDEQRLALPPVEIHLIEKMQAGQTTFQQMGASSAYCGDPAAASAEEGREQIDALASMIVESAREAWPDLFEA
ncbi:MAG: creatininase family protein [Planctomycetes bacterium]|nr:creatininase family protein [Planctomycetota bacterium]